MIIWLKSDEYSKYEHVIHMFMRFYHVRISAQIAEESEKISLKGIIDYGRISFGDHPQEDLVAKKVLPDIEKILVGENHNLLDAIPPYWDSLGWKNRKVIELADYKNFEGLQPKQASHE